MADTAPCRSERRFLSLFVALLLSAGIPAARAESLDGDREMLVKDCLLCHTGQRSHGIPRIHGQRPEYLDMMLWRYQTSGGIGGVMERLLGGYSNDELDALVEHFAGQLPTMRAPTDQEAGLGPALYAERCGFCHEKGTDGAPWLVGQDRDFLIFRLRDFVYSGRPMPEGMRQALSNLQADELSTIIDYLSGGGRD